MKFIKAFDLLKQILTMSRNAKFWGGLNFV